MQQLLRALRGPFLLVSALLLASCGGGIGAGPSAPAITVTPGDGRLTVNWTAEPGVTYAVYYAPGTTVSSAGLVANQTTYSVATNAVPPLVITTQTTLGNPAIANGTTYAVTLNGRRGSSQAGSDAPVVTATARAAGTFFTSGTDTSWKKLSPTVASSDGRLAPNTVNALRGVAIGPVISTPTRSSYVAVGDTGTLQVSADDGASWSQLVGIPTTANFKGVATDSGVFVAVGCQSYTGAACNQSGIYRSSSVDVLTATWAPITVAGSIQTLNAVASPASALLVAVGDAGSILTSADSGSTWTVRTSPSASNWRSVSCYSSFYCVTVGDGGAAAYSRDSGATWTAYNTGSSDNLRGVTIGLVPVSGSSPLTYSTVFLAVGDAGNAFLTTLASNGTFSPAWTKQTGVFGSNVMNAVAYGSLFMAVGNGGNIYYSADGAIWTQPSGTNPNSADLYAIAHAATQTHAHFEYVSVGAGGAELVAN